jgi:hypothetical protein
MSISTAPCDGQQVRSGTRAASSSLDAAPFSDPPGVSPGSSLDAEERSRRFYVETYRDFLISGVRHHYEHIERAYQRYDHRHETKRTEALQRCKTSAWFLRHKTTGEVRVGSNSCKVRFCPLCERAAKLTVTSQVYAGIRGVKRLRFLTLTLKHTSAPLGDQLDFLTACFRKLRKAKYFKARVQGGIWFLQLTRPNGEWHPHLHCLLDGQYIEHAAIKRMWAHITKGSTIVDIRAVKQADKAAEYVARYAQQPTDPGKLLPEELDEVLDAFNGRHTKGCWGTLKGIPLTPQSAEDAGDWELLGSWYEIASLYRFSARATQIVDAWFDGHPLPTVPNDTGPPAVAPTPTFQPFLTDFYPTNPFGY